MPQRNFVTINYITCQPGYQTRFEELFATRAHAIDRMPGFVDMQVLKPTEDGNDYLIVSYWESEDNFKAWTGTEEFIEGHKRGFEDIRKAKEEGRTPPITSDFKTYTIMAK